MIWTFLSGTFFGLFVNAMRRRDIDTAVVSFTIACGLFAQTLGDVPWQ